MNKHDKTQLWGSGGVMKKCFLVLFMVFFLAVPFRGASAVSYSDFYKWLDDLREEALYAGISDDTVNHALSTDLEPIERVVNLDKKQPEKVITFEDYKKNVVNPKRIALGSKLIKENHKILKEISRAYGVEEKYIVALWGIETNFGQNTGGFEIVPALVTLAYEGRRSSFFKSELFNALRILDEGHIQLHELKGSWAGAMGQCQFMPSSYHAFAVDYDGDGKKDIWNTKADVFASIANYLLLSGWKKGEPLLEKIEVPSWFDSKLVTLDISRPVSFWKNLGVKYANGKALPNSNKLVSIVQPGGEGYKLYLAHNNYKVIMKWNKSTYFATSVKYLADYLKK